MHEVETGKRRKHTSDSYSQAFMYQPGVMMVVNSQQSGIMHFSTSATSVLHMDPSVGGIFTMRSRLLMPNPQVVLQGSHSPHSVTTQLLAAVGRRNKKDIDVVSTQWIKFQGQICHVMIRTFS